MFHFQINLKYTQWTESGNLYVRRTLLWSTLRESRNSVWAVRWSSWIASLHNTLLARPARLLHFDPQSQCIDAKPDWANEIRVNQRCKFSFLCVSVGRSCLGSLRTTSSHTSLPVIELEDWNLMPANGKMSVPKAPSFWIMSAICLRISCRELGKEFSAQDRPGLSKVRTRCCQNKGSAEVCPRSTWRVVNKKRKECRHDCFHMFNAALGKVDRSLLRAYWGNVLHLLSSKYVLPWFWYLDRSLILGNRFEHWIYGQMTFLRTSGITLPVRTQNLTIPEFGYSNKSA